MVSLRRHVAKRPANVWGFAPLALGLELIGPCGALSDAPHHHSSFRINGRERPQRKGAKLPISLSLYKLYSPSIPHFLPFSLTESPFLTIVKCEEKKGGGRMLRAYKHNENHVLCEVPLGQLEKGSWINCAAPDTDELNQLNQLTGIPVDSLQTALDREERSHVELEDDYIFVVVNTPVVLETDAYDALPLGIFITRQYFITVCLESNAVIQKFLSNSFASFQTYKKTRFLFQILSQASSSFLFFLQQIYKQTDVIENQVRKSLQNKELFRMLELQKSLTYFNFALHANENVMERLMRLRNSPLHSLLKMYEEDEDLLEDVIIENKQALEMAEIYTNILMSMMDSFSSIISNRLSQIMKFLTSVTIILAIPTLIFSLWGINVPVPWGDAPLGFVEVILIGVLVTMIATFILWKKDML